MNMRARLEQIPPHVLQTIVLLAAVGVSDRVQVSHGVGVDLEPLQRQIVQLQSEVQANSRAQGEQLAEIRALDREQNQRLAALERQSPGGTTP